MAILSYQHKEFQDEIEKEYDELLEEDVIKKEEETDVTECNVKNTNENQDIQKRFDCVMYTALVNFMIIIIILFFFSSKDNSSL
jgi:hypothetical protein